MSKNLLEVFKQTLGDDVIGAVAARLGESEPVTRAAFERLLPVLLAGMVERGATPEGATALAKTVASVPIDAIALAHPEEMLTQDTGVLERLMTMGPGLLGFLFGNKAQAIAGALSGASGVRASSASWLGAWSTSLACALLNREIRTGQLDPLAVQALLAEQQPALRTSLDPDLVDALSYAAISRYLPDDAARPAKAHANAAPAAPPSGDAVPGPTTAPDSGNTPANKTSPVWIAALVVVLAVLAFWWFR